MIPRYLRSTTENKARLLAGILGFLISVSSVGYSADSKALPMVAVVPLEGRKVDSLDARTLTDALADQLLKTKAVRVMERSQMEAVLKEQGFQQSGACDGQECAVQIGKLLGIDRIVVGSVASFGKAYTIAVREVDVQTGEVLVTASKNLKGDFEDLLTDIVPQIAIELANPDQVKSEVVAAPVPGNPATVAHESQPASTTPPEQTPPVIESKKSGTWGWWVAGGLVVAGGTTAAVLLLNDNSSNTNTASNTDITVRWAK